MDDKVDTKYYQETANASAANALMIRARSRNNADFLANCRPRPEDKILDVGVSDVINDAANLVERSYPLTENITAVGLGPGADFKAAFPKVAYRQIQTGTDLPFADRHFDIAVSNAVLEHVGSRDQQKQFVAELLRVSKKVFITVPNRFFPIEHHTAIPFLHWFDPSFRWACRVTGKAEWSRLENLILMSRAQLLECCPRTAHINCGVTGILLGPFSSNLYLLASEADDA